MQNNRILTHIAETYGTPCYVYDENIIQANFLRFQSVFKHVYYAVKANNNLAILAVLAKLGAGFDIVSAGELTKVLTAGGDPQKIVFSGVGKQDWEIQQALEAGIGCFNIESVFELHQIQAIAQKLNKIAPIAVRVNPDISVTTHPYISTGLKENKFGIAYEAAFSVYQTAQTLSQIQVIGIACHLGSQIFSIDPYITAFEKLLNLSLLLKKQLQLEIRHIDMGGGFGVQDSEKLIDIESLSLQIKSMLSQRSLSVLPAIWIEPGRAIVAEAGLLLTRVIAIKTQSDKHFAIVDAGMNDLIRPALYQAHHDIVNISQSTKQNNICYDIVGPVCETGDFLGKNRLLSIHTEDLLAIKTAGAYGFSMASNYNARGRPAEILIDNTQHIKLIRSREFVHDLMIQELIHTKNSIAFKKMQGLGNDFVVINNIDNRYHLTPEGIRKIANRHCGIGCDQVLLLEKSDTADIDFRYKIYNADGSVAGQCGNGARCLAKFIKNEKLSNKKHFRVQTNTTTLELYLQDNGEVQVNMGIPEIVRDIMIQSYSGKEIFLGNSHIVFQVADINHAGLHHFGMHKYNVGFMQVIHPLEIKLRVFESGAGETLACGSGACAAVVTGMQQGVLTLGAKITVKFPLGDLTITWQGQHHPVFMTGPAETVFAGEFLL